MLLGFNNPDWYDTDTIDTPGIWSQVGSMAGSPASVPGVRSDGYLGRPALTCISGEAAFVSHFPSHPAVNPVAALSSGGWVGARFRFETALPSGPTIILAMLNQAGNVQVCVTLNADGTLSLYRGTVVTLLVTTATVLALDTTYRICLKANVSGSAGRAQILLNRTVIAQSDESTQQEEGSILAGFLFGLPLDCAVNHTYWGDVYGHQPEPFPAGIVKYIAPAAVGFLSEWNANVGSVPGAIDDTVPDFDTTTIGAPVDGDGFVVQMGTLDETPLIYSVQATALIKNIDTANNTFRHLFGSDGVVSEGDRDWSALTTDYVARRALYYIHPPDSEAWNTARVNAGRFGGRMITGG